MYVFLYWLGTQAYFLAIRLAALWQSKARLAVQGRKGLLKHIQQQLQAEQRPSIWMHCASLGEFEQGRPVLEKLRIEYPGHAFVLTFFSPSGYEVRKDYDGADYVFYLPFDNPANAKGFVDTLKPKLVIIVKYEYWYFLLRELERNSVSLLLIAGIFRDGQPFFKWYGGLHKKMLHMFSHLFVQDKQSKNLLYSIDINNVTIAGDPRFDRVLQIASAHTELPIAKAFCEGGKPILIAGSTWHEDEELLAVAWQDLKDSWKLIVVPHEVDKEHIAYLQNKFGMDAALWSDGNSAPNKNVLIVDTIGVLSQLYLYGTVAYIGGGFGKEGIHNVLEAAVYGMPCLHGPVYKKYLEAVELLESGGSIVVQSSTDLQQQLQILQSDAEKYQHAAKAAAQYVQSKAGATDIILNYLREKNSPNNL